MADKSNDLKKGEKTRILLLNTAERLFGQNGVTATSLREVMKVADVNMAMVHYYFKNKDGLLDAILERRLVPINQARLNLLGQYSLKADGQPLGMDDIIKAYVEPFIRLRDNADEGGADFLKLFAWLRMEPNFAYHQLMKKHLGDSLTAFQKELKRSLPDKTDEELNWKWAFLGGTVVMTITLMDQIDWFNDKGDMGGSADWIIKNLVNYTSAGFQSSFIPEPTLRPSA
ncbi:MAG: AcrR family transcriptional regulator [Limisphaerales bacterium]|jgi:AcrR family transcriptional regulator